MVFRLQPRPQAQAAAAALLLALCFAADAGAAPCISALDCSLNGECHDGECKCSLGWTGKACGVLNLAPTPPGSSTNIYPAPASNMSSWGGGVVFRDGKYHLYVSEMMNHCGLSTWATNSLIRHAVSDTVDGVYAPREAVLSAWGHNAMPWVTPEGYVAVWHIGNGSHSSRGPPKTGCSNGTTPLNVTENSEETDFVSLSESASLVPPLRQIPYSVSGAGGPWKMMEITCENASAPHAAVPCQIDNPTPWSFRNGTTLLAHRGAASGGFNLLVAPHWSGPYRPLAQMITTPPDETECEDGFLFGDEDSGIHLLCHCNGVRGYPWDDHGRHAYSKNGIDWMWSEERTFKPTFMHTDGTNTSHISRQRPQLVFAPKRSGNEATSASSNSGSIVPTQLITGISVSSTNHPFPWQQSCGTELCSISRPCDLTATSMQAVLP